MNTDEEIRAYYLSEDMPSKEDTRLEFNLTETEVNRILKPVMRGPHEALRGRPKKNLATGRAPNTGPAIERATSVPRRSTAKYLRRGGRP